MNNNLLKVLNYYLINKLIKTNQKNKMIEKVEYKKL